MAGDDDAPAGITMRGNSALEAYLIVTVERARRFVEQPDQSGRRDQPGERQSSLARAQRQASRQRSGAKSPTAPSRTGRARLGLGPRSAIQNANVSRGVNPGLTPS